MKLQKWARFMLKRHCLMAVESASQINFSACRPLFDQRVEIRGQGCLSGSAVVEWGLEDPIVVGVQLASKTRCFGCGFSGSPNKKGQ